MHELSLIRQTIRSIEELYPKEELLLLEEIHLKIGELSNVEPILLQNAFDAVVSVEKSDYKEVKLVVEKIPIVIQCQKCGVKTTVQGYLFLCSGCGLPSNNIIQGEELHIAGLKFKD